MGWTAFDDYPQLTRGEIIRREFTQRPTESNPHAYGFEDMAERGSTVYAVMYHDAPGAARQYFGAVFLTQRKNGEFRYKDMGEDCGPYRCEAPLRIVDALDRLAPNPASENARAWRTRVREYHAAKRARTQCPLAEGMRVKYWNSIYILQRFAGPRRGWYVKLDGGHMTYRIPARELTRLEIL